MLRQLQHSREQNILVLNLFQNVELKESMSFNCCKVEFLLGDLNVTYTLLVPANTLKQSLACLL